MFISVRSLDAGVVLEEEAVSLTIKTTSGEITILDSHRPLMTELVACEARVTKKDSSTERFAVKGGFLEVNRRNQVLVLLD